MRRAALAVVVLALLVVAGAQAAAQGWTGQVRPPPIPATGDMDWMAFMPRTWRLDELPDAHRVDALGLPDDADWPQVAFRIHGSIASAEAVLVVPAPSTTGGLDARFNTGYRFHAISLDPPLALGDGRTLHRIYPGPLAWSNLSAFEDPGAPALHEVRATSSVPWPDANGTTPPSAPAGNEAALADLGMTWRLRNEPGPSEPFGAASPANLGIEVLLTLNDAALADPADLERTNVTFTFHFDFGAPTTGWSALPGAGIDAGGLYLNRTSTYATLRYAALATTDNGTVPVRFAFSAPTGQNDPQPAPRRVSTPVSMNATITFPPPASCTEACAPSAPTPGRIVRLHGELGFLAPTAAVQTTTSPPPTPSGEPDSDRNVSAPHAALLAFALLALLAGSRKSAK